jgi:hypothetical protein
MTQNQWKENLIIADADYIDRTAFDLIVNFERMLGRRVQQADLPRWLECLALDGGLRPSSEEHATTVGDQQTQVVLIYPQGRQRLANFLPADLCALNGQAFAGPLGEFLISAVENPSHALTGGSDYLTDAVLMACRQSEVRRIMVVPGEQQYNNVRAKLLALDSELTAHGGTSLATQKSLTLFAMQPLPGGPFRQELLGYSLMAALNIRGDEVTAKLPNS